MRPGDEWPSDNALLVLMLIVVAILIAVHAL